MNASVALYLNALNQLREQGRMLAFAQQHDWGQDAEANDDGTVDCSTQVLLESGEWSTEICLDERATYLGGLLISWGRWCGINPHHRFRFSLGGLSLRDPAFGNHVG